MGPANKGAVELIVYQASKRQFIQDTFEKDIEFELSQQYLRTTGRRPVPSEFNAWQISLIEVLKDDADPQGLRNGKIVVEQTAASMT